MMAWNNDGVGWMMMMMMLWAALIAAAVWTVLALTRHDDRGPQTPTARDVLDRRFAGGEISRQEYVEASRLLQRAGTGPN